MIVYIQMIETDDDKSKFEEIYETYRGLMYHIAFKRLKHVQDAEDVVHYVFMKIAENIKKVDSVSPRTKQLVIIMVCNRITDMLRVRSRHPVISYDEELLSGIHYELAGEDLLTNCIMQLPEQQQMVIWLKYVYGYSLHEISKLLDISLVSAQKIDQRAKKKIKQLYQEG